jgi:hypothetical protein
LSVSAQSGPIGLLQPARRAIGTAAFGLVRKRDRRLAGEAKLFEIKSFRHQLLASNSLITSFCASI